MARSPSDATRFTATGPYASSSPTFSSNPSAPRPGPQISFAGPVPANETPQQKIARLRAAAALAKRGEESQFDKMVLTGRRWANRAHRVTTYGLIGLTVLTAMMATAGITDMLLHNRRRRNEWLAQKQAQTQVEVSAALQALEKGTVTEDQMLLINRERAAMEADEARKNRPGMFKRAKNWMFSGLSEEEQKGGRLGAAAADTLAISHALKEQYPPEQEASVVESGLEQAVARHRNAAEQVGGISQRLGGPLDWEAQRAVDMAANTGRSWTSWLTGSR